MPEPIAILLEDLDAAPGSPAARPLSCVALICGAPGLTLNAAGGVRWRHQGPPALKLWVSNDERLCLTRPDGAGEVVVRRGGRSVAAPAEKPVVLLDHDIVEAAGRRLRVRLAGRVAEVHAPLAVEPGGGLSRLGRAAAAAAVLGAVVGAADVAAADRPAPPIEVREAPPGAPANPDWNRPKPKKDEKKKRDKKKVDQKDAAQQPTKKPSSE